MAKSQSSQTSKKLGGKCVERNLLPVNPKKQQFEPTPAQPVRQHARMAGTC